MPDGKLIFTEAPYIQYEQFFILNSNFRQYIEAILISSQRAPLQKTYEMRIGSRSFNVEFLAANR